MNPTRRGAVPLLVVLVLLAGCTSAPELPDLGSTIDLVAGSKQGGYTWPALVATGANGTPLAAPDASQWPRHVQQLVPDEGSNPGLAIDPDAGLVVSVFDRVLGSNDHGRTWETLHTLESPAIPDDVDRFLTLGAHLWRDDATGRLFVYHENRGIDFNSGPTVKCNVLAYSDDDGQTWTPGALSSWPITCGHPSTGYGLGIGAHRVFTAPRPVAALPAAPGQDFPVLVYDCVTVRLFLLFADVPQCWVSHDGGDSFARAGAIALLPLDVDCPILNLGRPDSTPEGLVVLPLYSGTTECPLRVASSADGGTTWAIRTLPVTNIEAEPVLAIGPDGTSYVAYRGPGSFVQLVRSTDLFETLEGPFRVSPDEQTLNRMVGLTVGSDGRVALAYLGTRTPQRAELYAVSPATIWHLFVTTSHNAAATEPVFITEQVSPEQDPVQGGCSRSAPHPEPIVAESKCYNLLNTLQVDHDEDGRVFVAFTDGCTPRNDCTQDPASAWSHYERHASVAVQVSGPSLFADKGTLPILGLDPPAREA